MPNLTKELVKDPSLWTLALKVEAKRVDIALYCHLEEQSLIYRQESLQPQESFLAAFEDIIYENPLLLSDFGAARILVDTPRTLLVPTDMADEVVCQEMVDAMWPAQSLQALLCPIPGTAETLVAAVEPGLLAFLRRTFLDAELSHPVAVLAKYFAHEGQSNNARAYAYLQDDKADIIILDNRRLLLATSFEAATPQDKAYYILAAAQNAGLNLGRDEIKLCGDRRVREDVAPLLRSMSALVQPLIFPSELMRAGKDVMDAPFPLMLSLIMKLK